MLHLALLLEYSTQLFECSQSCGTMLQKSGLLLKLAPALLVIYVQSNVICVSIHTVVCRAAEVAGVPHHE